MYYKAVENGYILCISTNKIGKEISEKEYLQIMKIVKKAPEPKEGKVLMLRDSDLTYEYVDEPDDPDKGGLTPEGSWKIIESSNISKENKALLKDYIYKEAK